MPIKRRLNKRRRTYPDAIERLLHGEPIEDTPENRTALIEATYFGDYPELPPTVVQRASNQLTAWSTAGLIASFPSLDCENASGLDSVSIAEENMSRSPVPKTREPPTADATDDLRDLAAALGAGIAAAR